MSFMICLSPSRKKLEYLKPGCNYFLDIHQYLLPGHLSLDAMFPQQLIQSLKNHIHQQTKDHRLSNAISCRNPWWCFPFEAIEALAVHLMWIAAATYCAVLAPKTLLATLIGVLGMAHFSLGNIDCVLVNNGNSTGGCSMWNELTSIIRT